MLMDKVNSNFRVGAHHKIFKLKHRKFWFINLTKLTVWGQYISNYKAQRLSVLSQEEYLKLCKNNNKINYFFPPPLLPHIPAPSTQAKKQEESCFSIQNRRIANRNRKETFRKIQTMTTPADHAVSLKQISDIINLFVSTLHSKIHDYQ